MKISFCAPTGAVYAERIFVGSLQKLVAFLKLPAAFKKVRVSSDRLPNSSPGFMDHGH